MVSVDYCLHKQCIKPSLRNIWNNNVNYVSAIIWILSVNSAGKNICIKENNLIIKWRGQSLSISWQLWPRWAACRQSSVGARKDLTLTSSAPRIATPPPPPGIWRFSLLTRASGSSVVHRENSCSDLVAGCSAKRSLEDDRCRKESVWVSETERWR